jgi:hypothetical protein
VTTAPDFRVSGDDGALAEWVADHPGALLAFEPAASSDLARAVGIATTPGDAGTGTEVALDALRLGTGGVAVNMIVLGTPPDRLGRFTRPIAARLSVDGAAIATTRTTTIVIATGQFLRGLDVVPRGHPGDGRLEVQVYRLRPPERRAMRARLPSGTHLPHPRIAQRPGRHVEVVATQPLALEIDGRTRPPVRALAVDVVAGAYRLLV